ncbi:carboxylate--amine ligase [Pseudonocardia bannensis]|uniref:ATP-grasp domain-containing protein n=1 Tax=Pseudonocardia bannensis TaxID=630973 RepID=A0A848DIR9_9PSEU|nr:hypothetical protein [Pseudonocardia bannensis]NMH92465.1 hypothetical protein [Pseudonocardia bannensis]
MLVRRGVQVHALATPHYGYVLAGRGIQGRVMPDIRRHSDAWLEELGTLGAAGGGVVLCGSDAATEWVTQNRAVLAPSLRSFESADGVHVGLMDKLSLYETARQVGVRVPWMHHVSTRGDLDHVLDAITYPCVLKPRLGHLAKQQVGFGTLIVESRAQLVEPASRLLDHGIDLLLTEVVPGPETGLEGAVAVRDRDGNYTLEYGRHKVRQWPPNTGVGSLLESAEVPETLAMNRRLLDHAGYHGIAACETKRHERTGELYLIEINVRIPASFGLADACDTDGSWRLYATLAGIPLPPQGAQTDGRKVMLLQKDLRAAWQRVRRHDASPADVVRSWRGVRDLGVLDPRDLMPAVAMAADLLRARRGAGRSKGSQDSSTPAVPRSDRRLRDAPPRGDRLRR